MAGGGVAIATVLAVPGDEAMVERRARANFLWRGRRLGLERACGGAALRQGWRGLRRDLAAVLAALGGALPRLWLN